MKELESFLKFMLEHKSDERIKIYKKIKYGFQHFFIEFWSDNFDKNNNKIFYRPNLTIIIDNRNKCIEIVSEKKDSSMFVENEEIVKKWSKIIDDLIEYELESNITQIIESSLQECDNKNLHREYLMKKIFKNESL